MPRQRGANHIWIIDSGRTGIKGAENKTCWQKLEPMGFFDMEGITFDLLLPGIFGNERRYRVYIWREKLWFDLGF